MYVRKFEADTMEEALQAIKQELGPDAIILKTTTNKGLRGAFKKKRIEITAAISEKSYTKKAKVDTVLTNNQKESFYNAPSSYISNMIDTHDNPTEQPSRGQAGYGKVGLNKSVQSVKDLGEKFKSGLDDFLSSGVGEMGDHPAELDTQAEELVESHKQFDRAPSFDEFTTSQQEEVTVQAPQTQAQAPVQNSAVQGQKDALIELQKKKIDELEKRLYELARNVERLDKKEPTGVYQLRTTLRSLGITEHFIQDITKKAMFELSEQETQNPDLVFEFALREMINVVQTEMPLFSTLDNSETPVITVLLSDSSAGQTSTLYKLAALKEDAIVIRSRNDAQAGFTEKLFNLNIAEADSVAEIISETRRAVEAGKAVFIDYKNLAQEINETKAFIDGLKRAFGKVEVLVCLSAIHSELYNRKVLSRYHSLSDGMIVSKLDLCLNYGSLFNLADEFNDLPFKFFGTGDTVPEDLEAATAERILAGMFHLN